MPPRGAYRLEDACRPDRQASSPRFRLVRSPAETDHTGLASRSSEPALEVRQQAPKGEHSLSLTVARDIGRPFHSPACRHPCSRSGKHVKQDFALALAARPRAERPLRHRGERGSPGPATYSLSPRLASAALLRSRQTSGCYRARDGAHLFDDGVRRSRPTVVAPVTAPSRMTTMSSL